MEIQNYAGEYRRKSDDELLLIAARADQLVPEAVASLRAEIAHRGLSQQDLQDRLVEWHEQAYRSREKAVGRRVLFHVAWMLLIALMGFGLTLMNRCCGYKSHE